MRGRRRSRSTSAGPALGEIVSEGALLGEQDQVLATFRQRLRAWLGRPLLEMRIEIVPRAAAGRLSVARLLRRPLRLARRAGHARPRLERHRLHHARITRPQTPDFLDLRPGRYGTVVFPGGLPFHQRQEGRMLDVILIPEGEKATTFDLGIALDREQPMQTALGSRRRSPSCRRRRARRTSAQRAGCSISTRRTCC